MNIHTVKFHRNTQGSIRKLHVIDASGNGFEFLSVKECAKALNVTVQHVNLCLRTKRRICGCTIEEVKDNDTY